MSYTQHLLSLKTQILYSNWFFRAVFFRSIQTSPAPDPRAVCRPFEIWKPAPRLQSTAQHSTTRSSDLLNASRRPSDPHLVLCSRNAVADPCATYLRAAPPPPSPPSRHIHTTTLDIAHRFCFVFAPDPAIKPLCSASDATSVLEAVSKSARICAANNPNIHLPSAKIVRELDQQSTRPYSVLQLSCNSARGPCETVAKVLQSLGYMPVSRSPVIFWSCSISSF